MSDTQTIFPLLPLLLEQPGQPYLPVHVCLAFV